MIGKHQRGNESSLTNQKDLGLNAQDNQTICACNQTKGEGLFQAQHDFNHKL